jgi:hypothetical protein
MRIVQLVAAAAATFLMSPLGIAQVGAELQCIETADDETLISELDAEQLCAGSTSATGPVDCYREGDSETTLSNIQLIALCRCAVDSTPVACFEAATASTDLFDDKVIRSCSAIETRKLRPDCTPRER